MPAKRWKFGRLAGSPIETPAPAKTTSSPSRKAVHRRSGNSIPVIFIEISGASRADFLQQLVDGPGPFPSQYFSPSPRAADSRNPSFTQEIVIFITLMNTGNCLWLAWGSALDVEHLFAHQKGAMALIILNNRPSTGHGDCRVCQYGVLHKAIVLARQAKCVRMTFFPPSVALGEQPAISVIPSDPLNAH